MKAAVCEKYGGPEVLKIKDVKKPVPKDDEVLVKIFATVVTSGDVRMRKADPFIVRFFNGFLRPKKAIMGINFSGIVEQACPHVKEFKAGDEVFGSTVFNYGCYAEYVCVKEKGVIAKKPANISFEEAAVVPFGGLTSLHFLKKAGVEEGQKVLVYGASGALGTAGVQLAKYFGSEVTGVCGSNNMELVRSIGADRVIDYTKEDFTKSGETYDVIYDTLGKTPFFRSLKSLKERGVYLDAVHIPPFALVQDLWVKLSSKKKIVGGISKETKEDLEFWRKIIEEGRFKPVVGRTFDLDDISKAHAYVETGHKVGNAAITVHRKE